MTNSAQQPSARRLVIAAIAVFAVATVVRVPSCYESFWVDELHSAWVVWDGLGEVANRSTIGHQSPFYFWGLWIWKQVVGESEVMLRLSSVLAVALGSAVLTVGIARWTESLAAGITAGLILAIESNSLFFGTELRPFALVILFASIAAICFLRLQNQSSRHQVEGTWVVLVASVLLSGLSQPTSLGVLVPLVASLLCVWVTRSPRQLIQFSLTDLLLALVAIAIGWTLWFWMIDQTWHERSNWATFAKATELRQLWEAWDWIYVVIIPLGVAFIPAIVLARRGARSVSHSVGVGVGVTTGTLVVLSVGVLATSLYWCLSRFDWLPIWHRRYFVAVLPLLACVAGGCIGLLNHSLVDLFPASGEYGEKRRFASFASAIPFVACLLLVGTLAHQQGSLVPLRSYPVALVTRGEDWRGAAQWVRRELEPGGETVYLDSGLIENLTLFDQHRKIPGDDPRWKYIKYPLSGPYQLPATVTPVSYDRIVRRRDPAGGCFIVRRPANHIRIELFPQPARVTGFGNVSVILAEDRPDRKD